MPAIDGEIDVHQNDVQQVQTDGNASFLRAARAGNLEKVLEYLKGSIDINTSNANGLNALHLASKEGHVTVVTELLKRGANVDAATKKGNTALHIASLAGRDEIVKILIQHGASVNVQSQNGFTPLYMAAQENHDAVVKFLLTSGANQSLATEDGFTPLAVALQQGHDKVVTVLLENDTRGKVRLPALHIASKKDDCKAAALLLQNDHNPDVTSKSGFTPLHIAAHYGNENIAELLSQRGADVNYAAKHNITPLHVAAKWGKINMVQLLLAKNATIDAKTRDGLSPLHCAARSGHDQCVDLLLERGAFITAKTKNGLAPLHMAAQGDHLDSARIILYHKAPVDDVTMDYLTALHVSAHCGHVRVAKLLLDRKADANARALNGFTPLHIACKKNRIKVVELLLKHGASIEATTESGLTPLHVASFMGCMNIVIYLIQHGSNPDVPTVRGETPLHLAARANQIDIIRILLRNGAHVDARAREQQTPLHIASRLGNSDVVALLLQHGAAVDAATKDMYTALHIASKEEQDDVVSVLLDHGAALAATTKKGFTPLHLAAKYGNMKVTRLLLQKDAPVDAQGKNGVTPLHVAAHYDHQNVALLLLDKGASPHATAKNGYTPLHIAAKKNQMDIATTLLEYGAQSNAESKAGFTPLHLASQEGHTDMTTLLLEHHADPNAKAKNGLTPLHLSAQEDRVNVAAILVKSGAEIDPKTKAGYTPLHVASHFGQLNMVRFLLQHEASVNSITALGYTPLHQAAQQGHTVVVNLLLEHKASPNATTNQGQTALSIAQRLGYISVVETLKVVTETIITTTTTTVTEEKYKVVAPETMQETFMSDSEEEGVGEDNMFGDQSYRYLTVDEMKSLGDDSMPMDPTRDEKSESQLLKEDMIVPPITDDNRLSPTIYQPNYAQFTGDYTPDNVDVSRSPIQAGKLKWKTFLVSFMVDARGGAMRGCRHSGVRVIIPPRKASMPTRITCRYLKKEKILHPPPLMEGEACASRILEMGPMGAKFLGPVIIEVPHFASLRGKEREIVILRSDNGETWREHTLEATEEAVQEVLNESFDGEELNALEDLNTNRITRILTTDFPQYFAVVSRVRQEVHAIGPEGGMVSSTVVPQVQAVFPDNALTKKIKVGLQAQPIPAELVAKMLGNRVAVSPIVTVEPRRRKFHKPIVLTIPVPQAASKGMLNQYSGDAPTLRLLCSITGGTTRAQWEDVTGSTPLTFVNDCVSFTTTVSARFWLMDCLNINEATKMATDLYREAIYVPFMAKFCVFAKRHDSQEARLRVFCMTDDKEEKTLESQEHFIEVAKSRDVEVLEGKQQFVEFAGNLVPVTKSGEQLSLIFNAFRENRLPFTVRVRDPHQDPAGRIAFMREARVGRGEPPQTPICNLNIALPNILKPESPPDIDSLAIEKQIDYLTSVGLHKESIHRAELRLSDIARLLDNDWTTLAFQLDMEESDINVIKTDYPDDVVQQAMGMLRLWVQISGNKATGNVLEKALRKINREDIVEQCIFNVELVTDDVEKAVAKVHLDQSGFDTFKEELGSSREASLRRDMSFDASYEEQDIMKEAESAEETSSEAGSLHERRLSGGPGAFDSEIPARPKAMEKEVVTVEKLEKESRELKTIEKVTIKVEKDKIPDVVPAKDTEIVHLRDKETVEAKEDAGVAAETVDVIPTKEAEILSNIDQLSDLMTAQSFELEDQEKVKHFAEVTEELVVQERITASTKADLVSKYFETEVFEAQKSSPPELRPSPIIVEEVEAVKHIQSQPVSELEEKLPEPVAVTEAEIIPEVVATKQITLPEDMKTDKVVIVAEVTKTREIELVPEHTKMGDVEIEPEISQQQIPVSVTEEIIIPKEVTEVSIKKLVSDELTQEDEALVRDYVMGEVISEHRVSITDDESIKESLSKFAESFEDIPSLFVEGRDEEEGEERPEVSELPVVKQVVTGGDIDGGKRQISISEDERIRGLISKFSESFEEIPSMIGERPHEAPEEGKEGPHVVSEIPISKEHVESERPDIIMEKICRLEEDQEQKESLTKMEMLEAMYQYRSSEDQEDFSDDQVREAGYMEPQLVAQYSIDLATPIIVEEMLKESLLQDETVVKETAVQPEKVFVDVQPSAAEIQEIQEDVAKEILEDVVVAESDFAAVDTHKDLIEPTEVVGDLPFVLCPPLVATPTKEADLIDVEDWASSFEAKTEVLDESVTGYEKESQIVEEVEKVADLRDTSSAEHVPGEGLEAARLAESETWTSQEFDRSTPDLLKADLDVRPHGPLDDKRKSWEEDAGHDQDKEWIKHEDSDVMIVTKSEFTGKETFEEPKAISKVSKIEDEAAMEAPASLTADLETPIEGPDAEMKSKNQKMIEVTERVAEVASNLASTLEKVEMDQKVEKSKTAAAAESKQWPPSLPDEQPRIPKDEKPRIAESEKPRIPEDEKPVIENKVPDLIPVDVIPMKKAEDKLPEEHKPIPVQQPPERVDEERAVKAEIKLLVKTSDMGREAIEIRSIREFVETDASKKGEMSRIFAEAAASKAPDSVTISRTQEQPPQPTKVSPTSLEPCLGSISIAYEEPPHYEVVDKVPSEGGREALPDIMQYELPLSSDIGSASDYYPSSSGAQAAFAAPPPSVDYQLASSAKGPSFTEEYSVDNDRAMMADKYGTSQEVNVDHLVMATSGSTKLEVELSEVRTEDEAPEIEDFIMSPAGSEQRVITSGDELKSDADTTPSSSSKNGVQKGVLSTDTKPVPLESEKHRVVVDESGELEMTKKQRQSSVTTNMILDFHAQSSLEVEVGSRESDECVFSEEDNRILDSNEQARMELLMRSFGISEGELKSTSKQGLPDISEEDSGVQEAGSRLQASGSLEPDVGQHSSDEKLLHSELRREPVEHIVCDTGSDTVFTESLSPSLTPLVVTELTEEELRNRSLPSEVVSPPVITTPTSQRKLLPSPPAKPESYVIKEIRAESVDEVNAGARDQLSSSVSSTSSGKVLVMEPSSEGETIEPVVDRHYSSPDLQHLVTKLEHEIKRQDVDVTEAIFREEHVSSTTTTPTTHSSTLSNLVTTSTVLLTESTVLSKLSPLEPTTVTTTTSVHVDQSQLTTPTSSIVSELSPLDAQFSLGVSPTEFIPTLSRGEGGEKDSHLIAPTKSIIRSPRKPSDETPHSVLGGTLSPSAPPLPCEEPLDATTVVSDVSSDTETSLTTVVHRVEPIGGGFLSQQHEGDWTSSSSLTGTSLLSDREESFEMDSRTDSIDTRGTKTMTTVTSSVVTVQHGESLESDSELSATHIPMGFENQAFAGVDRIDDDATDSELFKRAKSPFEVVRGSSEEDIDEHKLEKFSLFVQEKSFKSEIFKNEMLGDSSEDIRSSLESKELHRVMKDERTESVEQHIRSEIFTSELEEAIESQQPEIKTVFLNEQSTMDEKTEHYVAQRMKSDILSEELEHTLEDLSPEQKDLPRFPQPPTTLATSPTISIDKLTPTTKSATESPAEPVLWVVPVQEQIATDTLETTEEIPARRQVIFERDEDVSDQVNDEEEESEPDTANIEDVERATREIHMRAEQTAFIAPEIVTEIIKEPQMSAAEARIIAQELVEEIKTEVARRPPLRHIPSEISEEDLVERFGGGSPDHVNQIVITQFKEEEQQIEIDKRHEFSVIETSSIDISDEELRASSDDLSPAEQHAERLESLSGETNLRRQSLAMLTEEERLLSMDEHKEWKASTFEEESSIKKLVEESCVITKEAKVVETEEKVTKDESFSQKLYTLERDRERRAKQEQEFQEVVKMRREKAMEQRERERDTTADREDVTLVSAPFIKSDEVTTMTSTAEHRSSEGSSGESPYYSALDTDSGHTSRGTPGTSRPCSSDVETLVTYGPGSSDYDTCLNSATSQEYATAPTSLRGQSTSASIDSESSSGHLASVEGSSEASETLMPSALEFERDNETPTIDDERFFASEPPIREPYDREIPEHVIRGRMTTSSQFQLDYSYGDSRYSADAGQTTKDDKYFQLQTDFYEEGAFATGGDGTPGSPFEMISSDDVAEFSRDVPHPESSTSRTHISSLPEDDEFDIDFKQRSGLEQLVSDSILVAGSRFLPDEISLPIASAPPAEDDDVEDYEIVRRPDSYSQANGPVEVEYQPEFDVGPDDEASIRVQQAHLHLDERISSICPSQVMPVPLQLQQQSRSDISDDDLSEDESVINGHSHHLSASPDVRSETFVSTTSASMLTEERLSSLTTISGASGAEAVTSSSCSTSVVTAVDFERPESELPDLDLSSRPQSHAESDSELQRPYSELQFSDDRPDSELTDLMKLSEEKEEEMDPEIERPLSPEPLEEYAIREEDNVEEMDKTGSSRERDVAHVAVVSPAPESSAVSEKEPSSPHEKHEFETSERSAKDKASLSLLSADIPDITVTQHVTPTVDIHYEFPGSGQMDKAVAIVRRPSDVKEEPATTEDSCEKMKEKVDTNIVMEQKNESTEEPIPIAFSSVTVKPLGVQYYPDDTAEEDKQTCSLEEKGEFESQEKEGEHGETEGQSPAASSDNGSVVSTTIKVDTEKWISMQFEDGDNKVEGGDSGASYSYQMEFEREFYARDEELEDILEEDEKVEIPTHLKESKSSTPDYDILAGRKCFSKSGEHDDASVSSLQEFERLEEQFSRRLSSDSQESLNNGGNNVTKKIYTRSGQGDDSSVNSLSEFELMEKQCSEAERIERLANEEAARLSEIEEGHESQASEAESQETLSEHGEYDDTDSNSDDYEKRMFEIDEIIKQAQTNVERFEVETTSAIAAAAAASTSSTLISTKDKSMKRSSSIGSGEVTESSLLDKTPSPGGDDGDDDDDSLRGDQFRLQTKEFDQDSLHGDEKDPESLQEDDVKGATRRKQKLKDDDCDSDSLKEEDDIKKDSQMVRSSEFDRDSLAGDEVAGLAAGLRVALGGAMAAVTTSGQVRGVDTMVSSTDSLEPSSSTATHATYHYETDSIMSSSFTSMQTSAEESTMMSSTDVVDLDTRLAQQQQFQQLSSSSATVTSPQKRSVFIEMEGDTAPSTRYMDIEGNVQTDVGFGERTYTDAEGNVHHIQSYETTVQPHIDQPGQQQRQQQVEDRFSHTIHRTVMMEPEVRTVTFTGPDSETKLKEFISQFRPGEDVVEMETTDDQGNVHVTRTVQHRVIMPPQVTTLSFSSEPQETETADWDIREYIRKQQTVESDSATDDSKKMDVETEVVEETDEHGHVKRITRKIYSQPTVETVSFSGPDARQRMEEVLRQTLEGFEPGKFDEKITSKDDHGNIISIVKQSVHVSGSSSTESPTAKPRSTVRVVTAESHHQSYEQGSPLKRSPHSSRRREITDVTTSPPSSPTVSTSSHSEDCYCGPEAAGSTSSPSHSAHTAAVGSHWPDGDDEDEDLPPATSTASRVLTQRGQQHHDPASELLMTTDDIYDPDDLDQQEIAHHSPKK